MKKACEENRGIKKDEEISVGRIEGDTINKKLPKKDPIELGSTGYIVSAAQLKACRHSDSSKLCCDLRQAFVSTSYNSTPS